MITFSETIKKADKIFIENFGSKVWFGKCIFISWHCDIATCKFCFRANYKDKKTSEQKKRSLASILAEAFIAKKLNWRLEFITGGCKSMPFDELFEVIKNVSKVYGEKIWINLGIFSKEQLKKIKPYVQGICASIETVEEKLHKKICPDKPIEQYLEMLQKLDGFKKSICMIIGLGEKKEDIKRLFEIIKKYKLDRITFYALKPIKGSGFKKSPESEDYAWWISQTRIRFPKLEIIAGLTPKKPEYSQYVLKAGANAITKFPAIRKFGSKEAKIVEQGIKKAHRKIESSLTKLPKVDWEKEVDKLDIDEKIKKDMKKIVLRYVQKMKH